MTFDVERFFNNADPRQVYGRFFNKAAGIGSKEEAQAGVTNLTRLYNYFERLGDRQGQHLAVVRALSAYHGAVFSGRYSIGRIYYQWLLAHLSDYDGARDITPEEESENEEK